MNSLLAASGISGIGDGLRQAAIPLLAATLTRSPSAVAAVAVAQTLSWLLISMPAGALVDRWDRRRTILIVNVVRGLLMLALGALVVSGTATLPLLVVLAFVFASVEVVSDATAQALLPAIVARSDLEWANGRLFALQTGTAQFVGPPLGGLLFAVSRSVPFLVDGVSFLAATVLLRRIRRTPPAETIHGRLGTRIVEGLRFLLRHRVLRVVALMSGFGNLMLQTFASVFVLYVLEELHSSAVVYGILLAVLAAGVTVGSLLAPRAKRRFGETAVLVGGAGMLGVPLGALAIVPNVVVTGVAVFLSGLGMGLWQVMSSSLRQAVTPDRLLGRVMASYRLVGRGASSLGGVLGGALAAVFGLRAPSLACALGMLVVVVLAFPALRPRVVAEAREVVDLDVPPSSA
ncbi:MFS transporter [Dactylosporangium sp. NPDC051484]|uniref:MFS transporter n=1 Tax=Dactylosporangium sp. NPDC051484 TaxID=3154942 RepID=UPI003450927B